ncbi:hypothetical protein ACFL6B_03275 [Thermodesulfobacteriota bacterium]
MPFKNEPDQFMPGRKGGEKTPTQRCQENTAALKKANRKILTLLDRMPLTDQREVVEINRLIEEQEKLVRVRIRGYIPIREQTLNDNEKYRANHLKKRYKEASRKGKLRI